jgi:hypothetical protein
MTKLDEAIDRALRVSTPPDSEAFREDAATLAKVLVRWHGTDAVRVLELATELVKAAVHP